MAVRVSQSSMFSMYVNNMNMSLADLMESNIQASSQKKINRPSDDSVGATRVLGYRDSIASFDQYKDNASAAKSWLALGDKTLTQVNTVVIRMKELSEQLSTGTLSKENREQISYELRQQFEQLINLSNTQFEGRHIFAGHKTEQTAFTQGLAVSSNDSTNIPSSAFNVTGGLERTAIVQITGTAAAPNSAAGTAINTVTDGLAYRYSEDGGATWQTGTMAAGGTSFVVGGATVSLNDHDNDGTPDVTNFTAVDQNNTHSNNNGSWLYVRPAAIYQGDDNNKPPDVVRYSGITHSATTVDGVFRDDVTIRLDNTTSSPPTFSYSTDNGNTWTEGNNVSVSTTAGTETYQFALPGGRVAVTRDSTGANPSFQNNDQFIVHPRRADVEFEISPGQKITVNSVGKDVFGGIYDSGDGFFDPEYNGDGRNLFEVAGRLVAYAETNNQQGIQEALDDLNVASKVVMTHAASIGGRENRLEVTENVLGSLTLDSQTRLSNIEDVDVAELMTRLSQQQLVYNSVLKSSSMVMKMNLTNFL